MAMAGKCHRVTTGNLPNKGNEATTKKKQQQDKQKQTSLLSFFGKPRKESAIVQVVKNIKTQTKCASNPEKTINVTPLSKQKNSTNPKVIKNTNDIHSGDEKNRNTKYQNTTSKPATKETHSNVSNKVQHDSSKDADKKEPPAAITPNKSPLINEMQQNPLKTEESDNESKDDASQTNKAFDCNISKASNNEENQSDEDSSSCDENDNGETQVKGKEEQKQPGESQNDPYALSEYELLRQRNIERNNARLQALGLLQPAALISRSTQKIRRPPRKKPKIVHEQRSQPIRRSTRNRNNTGSNSDRKGINVSTTNGCIAPTTEAPQQKLLEAEETYTVSPLWQYDMGQKNSNKCKIDNANNPFVKFASETVPKEPKTSGEKLCLKVMGPRFLPPKGLSAIYSLEFWSTCGSHNPGASRWLVGAGKAGMIALWDANRPIATSTANPSTDDSQQYVDPILSWKAHSGRWIADAKFLPSWTNTSTTQSSTPSRLLTAGNDGTICLWDLSAVSESTGAPKLLHRTGKAYHSSGIFCMDVAGTSVHKSNNNTCKSDISIATGSKDKSVAVTSFESLCGNTMGESLWRSNFHTAKVSAVKLKSDGSNVVASASDDGLVALFDIRTHTPDSPIARLEDAHDRPHSVQWDPTHEFTFVTAGLDPIVKVWDQRNVSKPMVCLQGHVPTFTSRCKGIHRPVFFEDSISTNRSCLLTGGQGSSYVSVYQWEISAGLQQQHQQQHQNVSSRLVSRGKLPEDCGDSGCLSVHGQQVAVAVEGGDILLLESSSS